MPAALLAPGSPSAGQGQLIKHIQTRSVQGPLGLSRRDFTVLASGGSDKNGRGERGPRDWAGGRGGSSFLPCARWKCLIQVGLGRKPALQDQQWGCLRAQGLQLRNTMAVYTHVEEESCQVAWELGSMRLLGCHRVTSGSHCDPFKGKDDIDFA